MEHSIVIGTGSCNYEHCCSCLLGNILVPDGLCNIIRKGADQCCTAEGRMNDFCMNPHQMKLSIFMTLQLQHALLVLVKQIQLLVLHALIT